MCLLKFSFFYKGSGWMIKLLQILVAKMFPHLDSTSPTGQRHRICQIRHRSVPRHLCPMHTSDGKEAKGLAKAPASCVAAHDHSVLGGSPQGSIPSHGQNVGAKQRLSLLEQTPSHCYAGEKKTQLKHRHFHWLTAQSHV